MKQGFPLVSEIDVLKITLTVYVKRGEPGVKGTSDELINITFRY